MNGGLISSIPGLQQQVKASKSTNGCLGVLTAGLRLWSWDNAKVPHSLFGMTGDPLVEGGKAFDPNDADDTVMTLFISANIHSSHRFWPKKETLGRRWR